MTRRKLTSIVVLFVFSLFGAAPLLYADEPEGDLKEMQGVWKIEAAERGGKEFDIKEMGIDALKFDGDKMSILLAGKLIAEYSIQLKPEDTPKKMAWIKPDKSWLPAIYEFKDGKLRICFPMVPTDPNVAIPRPESFDTGGKQLVVVTASKLKK